MADITTEAQYERTYKVYRTGVTERGTKADREGIGDFTIAMTCPKGFAREPQLRNVERMKAEKGFVIGHPARVAKPAKRKTKAAIKKEAEQLMAEAGANELPVIAEK